MENKSNEILYMIESSIKKGNANIESFYSNLISNLKKIIEPQKLIELSEENLSQKNIYFIRHVESEHNVLETKYAHLGFLAYDKWNIRDPKLTEKGKEQTNNIKSKLNENKIHFDSVFVSPLTRAIQTYFLIEKEINNDAKIIITDFAKEVVSLELDKNKGKLLSLLKEENKNTKLDFQYMTKEYWWFDLGKKIKDESEGYERFKLRLGLFILWLAFRPDKNILIISHSNVFVYMQNSEGIRNADMIKLNNKDLLDNIIDLFPKKEEEIEKKKEKEKRSCFIF
jgi:broad specificity phosphatase PhoE